MDDRSMRIEWRSSPEHARAAAAVAQRWLARRTLGWAIAWSALALSAVLLDSWCARLGIALPFGLLAFASFASARRRTAPLDRAQVRAWVAEARGRRADTFRDPASVAAAPTSYVSLDPRGVELGGRGFEHVRLGWSALRGVRALPGGHVLLLGRDMLGIVVPAWAFEADAQRETFIEHTRAWRAGAQAREPAEREPPPLPPSEDAFEVAVPGLALWRLQRGSMSVGGSVLATLFAGLLGCGIAQAALEWMGHDASLEALLESPLRFMPYTLAAAALAYRTLIVQALLALPRLRRHGVHRVRLSEHGFAWSTALWSGASSWTASPPELTREAVVLGGLTLPRAAFSAAQLEWLETRAPRAPGEPAKQTWRRVAVMVALLAIGVATYQLVQNDPEARPTTITEDTAPAPELAPLELARPDEPERSCELPSASVPATPLVHESAQCADLVVPEAARIEHCAAFADDRADRIAVVSGPWRRLRLWLHSGGQWRDAGMIAEWSHHRESYELASVGVLERGEPHELLVNVDRHSWYSSRGHSRSSTTRGAHACSLRDGRAECALLLNVAQLRSSWTYPREDFRCERAWYDVEWVGEQLAITHRTEVPVDPLDELDLRLPAEATRAQIDAIEAIRAARAARADRDWGGPPDGTYSRDELARWWDRR